MTGEMVILINSLLSNNQKRLFPRRYVPNVAFLPKFITKVFLYLNFTSNPSHSQNIQRRQHTANRTMDYFFNTKATTVSTCLGGSKMRFLGLREHRKLRFY